MSKGWKDHLKNRAIFKSCIAHRKLIDLIIATTPLGSKIIEIGCGTGILSFLLQDYGYNVLPTDIDISSIKFNLSSTILDIFERNHYKCDLIVHSGVMEHFDDEEIIKALINQRYMSPRLIFKVPNIHSKIFKKKTAFGDERLMSNKYWVKLIEKANWKVKVHSGDYPSKLYFWRLSQHTIFECGRE